MPQVAVAAVISGFTIVEGALAWSLAQALVGGALALASSLMMDDEFGEQKDPGIKGVLRNSDQAHRVIYGEQLVNGHLVNGGVTGNDNKNLHLVLVLAGHQCESIGELRLGQNPDQILPASMFDGNGDVNDSGSKYYNRLNVKRYLGTDTQIADQDLIDALSNRTINRKSIDGEGVPGITITSISDADGVQDDTLSGVLTLTVTQKTEDNYQDEMGLDPYVISIDQITLQWNYNATGNGSTVTVNSYDTLTGIVVPSSDNLHNLTLDVPGFAVNRPYDSEDVPPTNIFPRDLTSVQGTYTITPTSNAGKGWTSDDRGRGRCYAILNAKFNRTVFPQFPAPLFRVKGKIVYDPRDVGQNPNDPATWLYSDNAALCNLDYIRWKYGLNVPDARIDMDSWKTAANDCDVLVQAKDATSITSSSVNGTTITIISPSHGLRVNDTTVITGHSDTSLNNDTGSMHVVTEIVDMDTYKFEKSGATGGTGGTVQLYQRRYTCNGSFALNGPPLEILKSLLAAMHGDVVFTDKVSGYAGVARSVTVDPNSQEIHITDDDIDFSKPITISPREPRDRLINGVRGTFFDPNDHDQKTDFTPVSSAPYVTQDGEELYRDIYLRFTNDEYRCQRIAKLVLELSRQALVLTVRLKLIGLLLRPTDIIKVSIDDAGFVEKQFIVLDINFEPGGSIVAVLKEYAAAVYSWLPSYATSVDPAPNSVLTSVVPPPQFVSLVPSLYLAEDGVYRNRFEGVIGAPNYAQISHYEVQQKISIGIKWMNVPHGTDDVNFLFSDVTEGTDYDFRVRTVSTLGARSDWTTAVNRNSSTAWLFASTGLPDPINPKIYMDLNEYGASSRVRVTVEYDTQDQLLHPAGLALMWSVDDVPNAFVASGGDIGQTAVTIQEVELDNFITWDVLAGSTLSSVVVRSAENPLPPSDSLRSMWWGRVRDSGGTIFTKWHKFSSNDETTGFLFPGDEWEFLPQAGYKVEIIESGWHDGRIPIYRHLYATNGSNYEILRWTNIDGAVPITVNLERGLEGTSQIDLDGLTLHYYPSFGPGTNIAILPVSEFSVDPSDPSLFSAVATLDVGWEEYIKWASVSCMFYTIARNESNERVRFRSHIVPMKYGGFF